MVDFAADVRRWADKARGRATQAFVAIGEAALGRVKEYTPVRTGNLRAHWSLVPAEDLKGVGDNQPPLVATLRGPFGEVLALVNPTVYGPAVEYGRQIEKQDGTVTHVAGAHMLQQTITELPGIAENAVAKLR